MAMSQCRLCRFFGAISFVALWVAGLVACVSRSGKAAIDGGSARYPVPVDNVERNMVTDGQPEIRAAKASSALPRAWLFIFAYDAAGVRLVERKRIEMLAPPDDSPLMKQALAGHWIEVRNNEGKALYRQVIAEPFRVSSEVYASNATPHRVPTEVVAGRFQVVVPDLEGAAEVVLFGLGSPGEQQVRAFGRVSRSAEASSEASPLLTEKL